MDINAGIIDQQLTGILKKYSEQLPAGDDNKQRSAAFVLLCMVNYLDISLEEALDLLTDGSNDAGVDGLHIGEVEDGEFLVTFFQGKYKINNLDGIAYFPENSIEKAVNTVRVLFDPYRKVELNEKIAPKIEEIRSLISDAYIPNVRVILCNNGARWTKAAQAILAVLIFRAVENARKRPSEKNTHLFMPYASHYLSMLVGRKLLQDHGISLSDVSHRNFEVLEDRLQRNNTNYHIHAIAKIVNALTQCYGNRDISLQQLSATFRRGDLLEMLNN